MSNNNRLNSMSFDVLVGVFLIHVESMSLAVSDDGGEAMTNGLSDGWLEGAISASGSITVDSKNFSLLNEAARKAGSWQQLDPLDIVAVGSAGEYENQIIVCDKCKLKITDLLNIDKSNKDKTTHTFDFVVTGSKFVTINGVSLANQERVAKTFL